jgi:ubiquinone/menaquinone biosynthesis C-methylase UbiE
MDDQPGRRAVRATYERIASHFAQTRAYPWPEVESFVAESPEAEIALDLGCGNGRHVPVLGEAADRVLGLDASRNLLAEAAADLDDAEGVDFELLQGDASRLPIAAGTVGLAVYVATIHHLPDRESRLASLDELARVLGPDGRALVSAWSTAHDRFDADPEAENGFDTTVDWTLPDGAVVDRFYHIYSPPEFRRDLEASALTVDDVRVSSGNCYAEVTGRAKV